jgi:phytoene synthase
MSAHSLSARLARRSGSSFYYALRLLPAPRRRAIYALYSFCRTVDDCVDEPGGEGAAGLDRWGAEIERCYAGRPSTELGRELAAAVSAFPIPRACFEDVIAGCRMDLSVARYATFDELLVYCRRVASAVGLASIEIFGYTRPATREYAVELGLALQLTNILRDVGVDAARGRLYLPLEDLARFGVEAGALVVSAGAALRAGRGAAHAPEVARLLAFEAARAREHYRRAEAALPREDRRALLPARVMGQVYHALLRELQRRGFPFAPPVRLSRPRRAWIALRTLMGGR